MTQKFKARVHGRGGDKRHTLSLASRMETCFCDPFSVTVKDFVPESFQSLSETGQGCPALRSQRNILISHIIDLTHAAHSHRLCQLIWFSFLITHLLWKRKTKLCSHTSLVLSHRSTYLLSCAYLSCKLSIQKGLLFGVVPPWHLSISWQHKHLLKLMRWFGSCLWES